MERLLSDTDDTGGDAPLEDARFEDAVKPVRLAARDEEDLAVMSALLQDAAFTASDVSWRPDSRRFAFVANRYRWEEPDARERVPVGVHFDGVLKARSTGLPSAADAAEQPIAILAVAFEPAAEPPGGVVQITCAGGAMIELTVDALDAAVRDLGAPRKARATPRH